MCVAFLLATKSARAQGDEATAAPREQGVDAAAVDDVPTDDGLYDPRLQEQLSESSGPQVQAVQSPPRRLFLDVKIGGMLPVAFGPGTGKETLGYDFGLDIGWGWLPLVFGFDFGNSYGWDQDSRYVVQSGRQRLPVYQTQKDHIIFFNTWLRLQQKFYVFRPYVEGVVGGQWYNSDYTIRFADGQGSSHVSSDKQRSRSLGWGAGIDFYAFGNDTVAINFGVRRLYGTPIYGSQTFNSGSGPAQIVQTRTATDVMIYSIGLTGQIGL